MKTIITFRSLMVIIVIYASNCFSQPVSLGGRLGLNLSSQSNLNPGKSSDFHRSSLIGVQIGMIGNLGLTDLLSLQMELQFSQKGSKYQQTLSSGTENMTFKQAITINYLEIPVLCKASFPVGSVILYGNLGPYLGIALGGTYHLIEPVNSKEKLTFGKGDYRRLDIGLVIGAGVGYEIGPGIASLDLRYDLGLFDVNQPEERNEGYKSSDNRVFTIGLTYMMPLGK